jgi:hypothetical protein
MKCSGIKSYFTIKKGIKKSILCPKAVFYYNENNKVFLMRRFFDNRLKLPPNLNTKGIILT